MDGGGMSDTNKRLRGAFRTPGPWSMTPYEVVDAEGRVIASLQHSPFSVLTVQDNKELIAAAPDLLRLLQRYTAQDHAGDQCDELTFEADDLIGRLGNANPLRAATPVPHETNETDERKEFRSQ
jgi:hypothetical protein